jgi:large subunit ribosomal protein L15
MLKVKCSKFMIKLHQLKKHPKSTHRRKVVGRGLGSGHGTYSTRGGKGQTARTGHSKMPATFEGGRQPLVRQLPKSRGFTAIYGKATPVSLSELNIFNDGDIVTVKAMVEKGLIDDTITKVKILGGEIKKKLSLKVPVSASVKVAVEKAGGKIL